jgi:hypothetical protein
VANQIRWYKRDPTAALEGMAILTLEERGAYNTILDLIYAHDGCVDDDNRYIAGWLRCDVRIWKRIRARLIDLGKLYIAGNTLRNERADRVIFDAVRRIGSAIQAGRASGAKRRYLTARDAVQHRGLSPSHVRLTSPPNSPPADSKNKDLARTSVERTLEQPIPTKKEREEQPRKRPHEATRAEQEATFEAKRNGGA